MPWIERNRMDQRLEFVVQATLPGANKSALCKRYGISRPTGDKWIARYLAGGVDGMVEQSRRPHTSPMRTSFAIEQKVIAMRQQAFQRSWGAKKIHHELKQQGLKPLPSVSTINAILKRNGCIDPEASIKAKPWQRFEASSPNDIWQMDFKGEFKNKHHRYCYPLTILDDHSRFNLALKACFSMKTDEVKTHLITIFKQYGLPKVFMVDNGSPWANGYSKVRYTRLAIWLMRLGCVISYGQPNHPQTRGKEERFHRTLKADLLQWSNYQHEQEIQPSFDDYRHHYNHRRPHEAINMQYPIQRYRPSPREMPTVLAPIEYGSNVEVRTVRSGGFIEWQGYCIFTSKAFAGEPIAIKRTQSDHWVELQYCKQILGWCDLTQARQSSLYHLSKQRPEELKINPDNHEEKA